MSSPVNTLHPPRATPWGWALAGALLGLGVALVLFAPARWLAVAVQSASGQHAQLMGAQGSIWQGSARLVLTGGAASQDAVALPGGLAWRIRPRWNGAVVQINADCCTPQALQINVNAVGWSGLSLVLADSHSQWPAGLLAGLGTPWNTVQPQGQLEAASQGFGLQWTPGRLTLLGRLQLDALQMSSRLSTLVPMGSYRITLLGGAEPTLQLDTLEGSLQLTGQGQWLAGRLRFNGMASAAPASVTALSNLLNILGRRDGARSIITVGAT